MGAAWGRLVPYLDATIRGGDYAWRLCFWEVRVLFSKAPIESSAPDLTHGLDLQQKRGSGGQVMRWCLWCVS